MHEVNNNASVPALEPTPSPRQWQWHQLDLYGFIHFTVNTFTDKEWGYGNEDPSLFNPKQLDTRQWARVAREAGLKGLILTCKHHDGFCLWPSRYTEHSVKNSPWQEGKGDVVADLAAACEEFNLKFGIYLSPWDRHHPQYGSEAYLDYYRSQLKELLSQYGPIFEVWFDGANGGDGYYGGACTTRTIDKSSYYKWNQNWELVRELQPQAVIFSDAGPDVRWIGNERGKAPATCWSTFNKEGRYPGYNPDNYDVEKDLGQGHKQGPDWLPPEADVSLRPGWFFHKDETPKSVAELMDIYYKSVGRSTNLLLNLPPTPQGLIAENDINHLLEFRDRLDRIFSKDRSGQAQVSASSKRRENFSPARVIEEDIDSYWAPGENQTEASLNFKFPQELTLDHIVLQEYIKLGQRIEAWEINIKKEREWKKVASGTTIGYKKIKKIEPVTTNQIQFKIKKAKAEPVINRVSFFKEV